MRGRARTPITTRSPCSWPVKEGPFYALKVESRAARRARRPAHRTTTSSASSARVARPSRGLYALSNGMGDICAVDYPINVAGNSHGRCITLRLPC